MKRRLLCGAAAALAGLSFAGPVLAEASYPSRPVKVIVGFQAGGPTDVVARLVAKALQDELKGAFVVENKAGATGNIAHEMVASAKPDGYTLLIAASPLVMNKFSYPKQKYDPLKSFAPVSKVSSSPGVLSVSPKVAVKNYQDFLALAKQEPGKLTYGTTGAGGTPHMGTLRFEQLSGVKMLHVPYAGSAGLLNDLMAGNIDTALLTATGAMVHMETGRVRALAVAGPQRLPGLPQVPTFKELGLPAMASDSWNGLLAPAGTPQAIVDKLAAVMAKAVKTAEFKNTLVPQGAMLIGNSPAAFKAELQAEVVFWTEQFKNVKLEK